MKPGPITADLVKAQIQKLLANWPELRDDDEALALSLESETDATELCSRLVRGIKEAEAHAKGVAGYIAELAQRKSHLELRAERLERVLISILDAAGTTRLPLAIASVFTTPHRHILITERELIPLDCRRTPEWEPDKKLIGSRIKAGETVPGCKLSNAEMSLTIRMK